MQKIELIHSVLRLLLPGIILTGILVPGIAAGESCTCGVESDFTVQCLNKYQIDYLGESFLKYMEGETLNYPYMSNYPYVDTFAPAHCILIDKSAPFSEDTKIEARKIDFGDNTQVINDTVMTFSEGHHQYPKPGLYTISLKNYWSCCDNTGEDVTIKTVEILPPPPAPEIDIMGRVFVWDSKIHSYSQQEVSFPINVYLAESPDARPETRGVELLRKLAVNEYGIYSGHYRSDQYVDPDKKNKKDYLIVQPAVSGTQGVSPAGSKGWEVKKAVNHRTSVIGNGVQNPEPDIDLSPPARAVYSIGRLVSYHGDYPYIFIDWFLVPTDRPEPEQPVPAAEGISLYDNDTDGTGLLTTSDLTVLNPPSDSYMWNERAWPELSGAKKVPMICTDFVAHYDQEPVHYHTTLWLKDADKDYQFISVALKEGFKGEYFPGLNQSIGIISPEEGAVVYPDVINLELCPAKVPEGECSVKCTSDCLDGKRTYEIRNTDLNKQLPLDLGDSYVLGSAQTYIRPENYQQIEKDSAPLKYQYLYILPPDAKDILFIRADGTKEDSAAIAKKSAHCSRAFSADFLAGDCNRDQNINLADAGEMNRIKSIPSSFDVLCDMNGDRKIDDTDIDLLLKKLGKTTPAPTTPIPKLNTSVLGSLPGQPEPSEGGGAPAVISATGNSSSSILDIIISTPQALIAIFQGSPGVGGRSHETVSSTNPDTTGKTVSSDQMRHIVLPGTTGSTVQVTQPGSGLVIISKDAERLDPGDVSRQLSQPEQQPEEQPPQEQPVVVMDNARSVVTTACQPGQVQCSGACTDTTTDLNNCGACGNACQWREGEVCIGGQCMTRCPAGQTPCNRQCVDLRTDNGNCGSCGNKCENREGLACLQGACRQSAAAGRAAVDQGSSRFVGEAVLLSQCSEGLTYCSGACVNLQTDNNNCGQCGSVCNREGGKTCYLGKCMVVVS